MFMFSRRRFLSLLSTLLFLIAGVARCEDGVLLDDPKNFLNVLPIELASMHDFKIPPRPVGHLLDSAHFLPPETQQRLDEMLAQEARENGVNVYLLTVPSIPKNSINPFTKRLAEAWTKDLFGAVIVFDDGTGRVCIEASEKVRSRFYEFELSALLLESMSPTKRPRLSRDGLEHTTTSVKAAIHELKMRANREDRNSLLTRVVLAVVGIVALLVGAFEYFRRRPAAVATSGETASDGLLPKE